MNKKKLFVLISLLIIFLGGVIVFLIQKNGNTLEKKYPLCYNKVVKTTIIRKECMLFNKEDQDQCAIDKGLLDDDVNYIISSCGAFLEKSGVLHCGALGNAELSQFDCIFKKLGYNY